MDQLLYLFPLPPACSNLTFPQDVWQSFAPKDGYPDFIHLDPFGLANSMHGFNDRFGLNRQVKIDKDCPSFSVASTFFDGVVDAVKVLKGKLLCEVIQGDMCQELLKMQLGGDDIRPADLPRKFMRIWCSNVP